MEAEIYENLKIGIGLIEKNPDEARGHTLINTTWVYSTKLKDGNTVFKARLTARGDQEDPANINNDHRASPTADQDSIRLILAELANMPGAKLMSFDFVRAYLLGYEGARLKSRQHRQLRVAQTHTQWTHLCGRAR